MIRFTDAQIETLRELATPLQGWQRTRFLELVAERLANVEIGDGSVHAAGIAARRELLTRSPPAFGKRRHRGLARRRVAVRWRAAHIHGVPTGVASPWERTPAPAVLVIASGGISFPW